MALENDEVLGLDQPAPSRIDMTAGMRPERTQSLLGRFVSESCSDPTHLTRAGNPIQRSRFVLLANESRERTRELAGRRPPPGRRTATGVADRSTRAATAAPGGRGGPRFRNVAQPRARLGLRNLVVREEQRRCKERNCIFTHRAFPSSRAIIGFRCLCFYGSKIL